MKVEDVLEPPGAKPGGGGGDPADEQAPFPERKTMGINAIYLSR